MANDDHFFKINWEALRQSRDKIRCTADVFHCSRKATAFISHAPVLHAPGDKSRPGERGAEMSKVDKVVLRSPETTVDGHHQWRGTPAGWESQVSELERVWPIVNPVVRGRCLKVK